VVLTGAGKGIGFALAKNLLNLGHEVLIQEREQEHLDAAKMQCPELQTVQADIKTVQGRKHFAEKIIAAHPQVNVLINSATSNKFVPSLLTMSESDFPLHEFTVNVNLLAPIHLSTLFLPHFIKQPEALIANVTDILAFCPLARYPTFSATKAGLHSFTMSLRHQLKETSVKVVEIVPPLMEPTKLPSELQGISTNMVDFAKSTIDQLLNGVPEIGYHTSEEIIRHGPRDVLDKTFEEWNNYLNHKVVEMRKK
jgi:uncharacterized oxidoreductase